MKGLNLRELKKRTRKIFRQDKRKGEKTMTKTFYRTGVYEKNSSEYGGRICASDFYAKTTLSDIASRIISDKKFDEQCRKNLLNRQNYEERKNA